MSELIDRNVLKAKMYQEAFESDTDMQKWDSGCWIRYKLFEKVVDNMPTVPYSPRWHRVEEPPKGHMWCFVYTHDPEMIMPIRIAFYVASCTGKGSWYHYESGEDIDDEVDYWTPMYLEGPDVAWPIEPPKEDA